MKPWWNYSKYCTQMIFRATYSREMTSHAMWSLNAICQSQARSLSVVSFATTGPNRDYRFLRAQTIAGNLTRWIAITRSSDQQLWWDNNCLSPSSKYWGCLASLWTRRRLTYKNLVLSNELTKVELPPWNISKRPDQHSGSLNNWGESAAFVISSANGQTS